MKKEKKISVLQLFRLLSQILFFILLPSLYVCILSGFQQIVSGILHQNIDWSTFFPQIIELVAVIPITLIAGRFFCGWICAFGTLQDVIYKIFGRYSEKCVPPRCDRFLKLIKYALLLFLIVGVWGVGIQAFRAYSPWDAFGMLTTVGRAPDISYVLKSLFPAFVILLAIMVLSAFAQRFFCRYLCPLGAVFSIISKLRITKIRKKRDHCGACQVCTKSCSMGIPLSQSDSIHSGECIHCFKCVTVCPRENIRLEVAGDDIRPVIAGAMAVTAMTGIYYAGSLASTYAQGTSGLSVSEGSGLGAFVSQSTSGGSASSAASAGGGEQPDSQGSSGSTFSSSVTGKYKDGTYQGAGSGFRGSSTTVSVTVKNSKISGISVLSYGDDKPFFERAFTTVINEIISSQSTRVDAVSGATYSSQGIMNAVADALNDAAV